MTKWEEVNNKEEYINLDIIENVSNFKKDTYKIHRNFLIDRINKSNLEMIIFNKKFFTQEYIHFLLYNEISLNKLNDSRNKRNFYGQDSRTPEEFYIDLLVNELQELQFLLFNSNIKINESSIHNEVVKVSNNDPDFITNDGIFIEFQNTIQFNKRHISLKSAKFKRLMEKYKDKNCYILQQKINREDNTCLYKCIKLQDIIQGKEKEAFLRKSSFDVLNDGDWLDLKSLKFEKYIA